MKNIFIPAIICFASVQLNAQWSNTSNLFTDSLHMPVCAAAGTQENTVSVNSYPDGGYFVIWEDLRNNNVTKIFIQKFDKDGRRLWADNGVPVSAGTNRQHYTFSISLFQDYRNRKVAASDGAGGVYICYIDDSITNYLWQRMCIQHIKSDGSAVFPGAGFVAAQTPSNENYTFNAPQLVADDNSGIYLSFIKTNITDDLYLFCYKDDGGTMKMIGGGIANQNAVQKTEPGPCLPVTSVDYPGSTVIDYNIWPDLQGNCNLVMQLNGNGKQGRMLAYNKLWKAKQDKPVAIKVFNASTFNTETQIINYKKGDVDILYKLRTYSWNKSCGSSEALIVWTDQFLISNGFLQLAQGGYDYNFPKGVTVTTPGNINVDIVTSLDRLLNANNTLTNSTVKAIGIRAEKYAAVPYQRDDNNDPFFGYNTNPPAGINKLNYFNDTLFTSGIGFPDYWLAGGGNQIYTAILNPEPGQFRERNMRLQHLSVERKTADSFALNITTNSEKGVLIGSEKNTGFGGTAIFYDFPIVTVNNNGNALFHIREDGRYIRVSPIINGTELSWGAVGKPIGTPLFNGSFISPQEPVVSLDPVDGTGIVSWQDNRNVQVNTGSNVFMRHLDNINLVGYAPATKKIQLLTAGISTAFPVMLKGSSKQYSTVDAYNTTTGTVSPVIEILDNFNLGAITANVFQHTGPIRTFNSKPYLNRNYTIKPENDPAGNPINLKLFFTNAEFDALNTADPGIINPGNLVVIKQANTNATVPAIYTPISGEITIIPSTWGTVDGGYFIEVRITDFSNFFIQKGSGTLPVTWLGIQAQWKNNTQATINWQVANQVNVKDYTVQKSVDGNIFTNACTIAATAAESYSCTLDANSRSINYYRVLQKDLDGKISYSQTIVVQASTHRLLTVYPNPVADKLYISSTEKITAITITDLQGRLLQQPLLGNNNYISVSQLTKGIYFIRLSADDKIQTIKFIKK